MGLDWLPRDPSVSVSPTLGFKPALTGPDLYMGAGIELSNDFTNSTVFLALQLHWHEAQSKAELICGQRGKEWRQVLVKRQHKRTSWVTGVSLFGTHTVRHAPSQMFADLILARSQVHKEQQIRLKMFKMRIFFFTEI